MTVHKAKSHAVKRAAFQTDLAGRHFEARPLAGRGKRPGVAPAGRAIRAIRYQVSAPVGAVFPGPIVPLQHQLAGSTGRIEINVSKQVVARVHCQSGRGSVEVMLVKSGAGAGLIGEAAGEWGWIAIYPIPGIPAVGAEGRPGG